MLRKNGSWLALWMTLWASASILPAQTSTPGGSYSSSCTSCSFPGTPSSTSFQCQCQDNNGNNQQTSFNMSHCASNNLMNVGGTLACEIDVSVTCIQGQSPSVSPETITVGPGVNVIVFSLASGSTSGSTFSVPLPGSGPFSLPNAVGSNNQSIMQDNNQLLASQNSQSFTYTIICQHPDKTVTRKDPTIVNQGTGTP